MNLTEEKLPREQTGKKSTLLLTLLLFLLVGGIALFTYLRSTDADFRNISLKQMAAEIAEGKKQVKEEKKAYEVGLESDNRTVTGVYKDYIVQCTRDGVIAFDKEGAEAWNIPMSLNDPMMKTNGTDLLVADTAGRYLCVINEHNIKWEKKTENNIVNADISPSGHVTLIQDVKGYKGRVRVFDPLGIDLFYRNLAEDHVLAAGVSPSGEQLLISTVSTEGVGLSPGLQFFDMSGNRFAAKTPEQEDIFPSFWYFNDDSMIAASDQILVYFDQDRNEKWKKEYGKIYSSYICLGKYAVVAVLDESKAGLSGNRKSNVELLGKKGQKVASCQVEGAVRNIRAYSDVIAVNTVRDVYFVNSRGKILGKYSSKADVMDVYFFSRTEAALVTKNGVTVVGYTGG